MFNIGSKCCLILPRNFIYEYLTPSKGLVLNKLLNNKYLILIEEIWQYKKNPIDIGWKELPNLLINDKHLLVQAKEDNIMYFNKLTFKLMIEKSINDLKQM